MLGGAAHAHPANVFSKIMPAKKKDNGLEEHAEMCRWNMKNSKYDDLVAHQTSQSIVMRMEFFGDEFQRLASTAKQGAVAERFKDAVHEVVEVPLTAAELQPLAEWLKDYGDQFEQQARTPEQKMWVASFRGFITEITGPAVKDIFQKPLVNELIEEIESEMAYGHSNGIPLAWLSGEDKREFLGVTIGWTSYIDRGLALEPDTAAHIERIIDNAIAGKPSEQWIGRTDLPTLGLEDLLNYRSSQPAKAPEKANDRGIER
jgi:hypothetical protein